MEQYRPTVIQTLDPDPDIQHSDEATRKKILRAITYGLYAITAHHNGERGVFETRFWPDGTAHPVATGRLRAVARGVRRRHLVDGRTGRGRRHRAGAGDRGVPACARPFPVKNVGHQAASHRVGVNVIDHGAQRLLARNLKNEERAVVERTLAESIGWMFRERWDPAMRSPAWPCP